MLLLFFTVSVVAWIFVFPKVSAASGKTVQVMQVHIGRYAAQVQCSGTIQPAAEQAVSFGIPVKITTVHAAVGDSVCAGQVLIDIDRAQSLAASVSTQNNQDNDDDNGVSSSGSSGTSAASSDSSTSSDGETERIQQALSDWMPGTTQKNSGSMQALMQQYAQYAGSGSASQLESELSSQFSQGSPSADNSADTKETLAQQIPDQVTAPISGVVTQLNVSEGSFSNAATNLVVISDVSGLSLRAQVEQSKISQVHVGQTAQISVSASSSSASGSYTGTVTQIFPQAHTVTDDAGTKSVVDVLIRIQNSNGDLLPDMDADAAITVNVNPHALSVPYEAVQEDNSGQEFVFVWQGGRVYRKNIKTGAEFSNTVQVLSGLHDRDKVVISSSSSLKSGDATLVKEVGHV